METDDPENARIVLTVTANVLVDLDLETNQIRFKDIELGKQVERKIPFLANDPSLVKFGEVKVSREGIDARMVKAGDGWVLEVVFTPKDAGHLTAKIDVELLEPEKKGMTVFLNATVRGDIRVLPSTVSIQKGLEGVSTKRIVRLQADVGTFKVKKATESSGYLDIEIEEQEKGKVFLLHLTLTEKGEAADQFVTPLLVTTTSKKQPKIEIPVHVKTKAPSVQGPKPAVTAKPELAQPVVAK